MHKAQHIQSIPYGIRAILSGIISEKIRLAHPMNWCDFIGECSTPIVGVALPAVNGEQMRIRDWIDAIRFGKTERQMRWKASLFLRARRRMQVKSNDPLVIFALPLVSRQRAASWDQVQDNLNMTLASFLRQSDPNWIAIICGQDTPVLPADPRITFLPARIRDKFYDKGDKRRLLVDHVSRTVRADGYYMQFDCDDVLHPEVVAHLRKDHNGRGYVIGDGYFVSLSAGLVARLPDFHVTCGSSSAVYVDFRINRTFRSMLLQHRSHQNIPDISALFGQPLDRIPFPAALYMTGHGENMIQRRGRIEARTKVHMQNALEAYEAQYVCKEFGITPDWLTEEANPHTL